MKKKRLQSNVLIGAGLAIAGIYAVYASLFPVSILYINDDLFFPSERLWFRSSFAWLRHVLFFSQTRYTWVGDFMLCRPGLFAWLWGQDVLFRSHPEIQHLLAAAAGVFTMACLVVFTRKACGTAAAVAVGIYAFACPEGEMLFRWPHINPYVFALAFYTLGAFQFSSVDTKGGPAGPKARAALFFFLAELFHEFVAVTLVLLLIVEAVRHFRRRIFSGRIVVIMAPLSLYGLIVLGTHFYFNPPMFFSPGEGNFPFFSWTHLNSMFNAQWRLLATLFDILIPFNGLPDIPLWTKVACRIAFIGFLAWAWWKFRPKKSQRGTWDFLILSVLPFLAIDGGLSLSRLSTRGYIMEYYYQMLSYFLFMALAVYLGRLKLPKAVSLAIISLLLASAMFTATRLRAGNVAESLSIAPLSRTISALNDFFAHNPRFCYAGVLDPSFRTGINRQANITLQPLECGWRQGSPVVGALADADAHHFSYMTPSPAPAGMAPALDQLAPPVETGDLARAFGNREYNFREAAQGLLDRGKSQISWTKGSLTFNEVTAEFAADPDEAPLLYNSGLALTNQSGSVYFILENEFLKVFAENRSGGMNEIAESQVNEIKKRFRLRISVAGGGCAVFFDDFLLTQIPSCPHESARIGVVGFANGTPAERIQDLRYGIPAAGHSWAQPFSPLKSDGIVGVNGAEHEP